MLRARGSAGRPDIGERRSASQQGAFGARRTCDNPGHARRHGRSARVPRASGCAHAPLVSWPRPSRPQRNSRRRDRSGLTTALVDRLRSGEAAACRNGAAAPRPRSRGPCGDAYRCVDASFARVEGARPCSRCRSSSWPRVSPARTAQGRGGNSRGAGGHGTVDGHHDRASRLGGNEAFSSRRPGYDDAIDLPRLTDLWRGSSSPGTRRGRTRVAADADRPATGTAGRAFAFLIGTALAAPRRSAGRARRRG
jgi:hypothetical protein